jgi:hypothetical protein
MPVTINLSSSNELLMSNADPTKFNQLPVWMTLEQAHLLKYYSRWSSLFKEIPWQANMGAIMTNVIPQAAPLVGQAHRPKALNDGDPLVTLISHNEMSNVATVRRHRYESNVMNWSPSFFDFRSGQLKDQMDVMHRQMAFETDTFVRNILFELAEHAYVVGAPDPVVPAGKFGMPVKDTDIFKTPAEIQENYIAKVGAKDAGFLTYRALLNAVVQMDNLGIPYWSGDSEAAPADNAIVQGKYLLIGGSDIYAAMQFDNHVLSTKPLAEDLLRKGYRGPIGENIIFRQEYLDLRFNNDGTMPNPETEQLLNAATNPAYAGLNTRTVRTPEYIKAPIRCAFLIGLSPIKSIKVGMPPAEFRKTQGPKHLMAMDWNGQLTVTDNFPIELPNGKYTGNFYAEKLKVFGQTTLGAIPLEPRNIMPIFYRTNNNFVIA